VLGRGSGGDKGRGLVPIHVGACHLIRVLEAEARKLEFTPLNRQVIVATNRGYLGTRLKMDTHRSSVRPPRRERRSASRALLHMEKGMEALDERLLVEERRDRGANRVIRDAAPAEKFRQQIDRRALLGLYVPGAKWKQRQEGALDVVEAAQVVAGDHELARVRRVRSDLERPKLGFARRHARGEQDEVALPGLRVGALKVGRNQLDERPLGLEPVGSEITPRLVGDECGDV